MMWLIMSNLQYLFFLILGQHVINLFVQYTPYKLLEGTWQDPSIRVSCFSPLYVSKRCITCVFAFLTRLLKSPANGISTSLHEFTRAFIF